MLRPKSYHTSSSVPWTYIHSIRISAPDIFRLSFSKLNCSLTPGQNFSCRKILKILVVSNNINGKSGTFKIMPPYFKSIKNSQQFLVMNIIVEFCCGKSSCQGTSLAVYTPLYTLFTIHSLPSFYFAYIHLLLFGYHLNLSCSQ